MPHRFATFVAPLPAALALAVALWWAPTRADVREERNAGHVLGGVLVRGGVGTKAAPTPSRRRRW